MIARKTIALGVLVVAGCGSKPPPRTCSTEAPPQKPENGPLEIGMCPMEPLPDAGVVGAAGPDATADGG